MPSRFSVPLRIFLLVLLTSWGAAGSIHAQDRIQWEPVDGANHYRIEIVRDGELVLETRSDEPGLPLFLPPGNYEFRVDVINTFGKVAATGEWSPLRILAPVVPFLIDIQPREIHEGSSDAFLLRVSGHRDGSTYQLEGPEGQVIELSADTLGDGSLEGNDDSPWREIILEVGRREPGKGSWNLTMTNPDGRVSRMDNAVTVLERLRPRIGKFDPREIPAGEVHNPAALEISGLEENALVEFFGPSDIKPTLLSKNGEGQMEYSLNLKDVEPGWYGVRVTNPSGGSDEDEKLFQVTPRPLSEEELAAMNALEIDKREPRPIGEHPHSVSGGWKTAFTLGATADYYRPSWVGFTLNYSQEFHNSLVRRIPILDGLGWEASYAITRHPTNYPLYQINLVRTDILLGARYVTPFDFPVNLLLRASAGIGLSRYKSPELNRDEDMGSGPLRDLDSMDFVSRYGVGARIDINPRWFIDAACDIGAVNYLSRTSWSLQPRLEGGWRW